MYYIDQQGIEHKNIFLEVEKVGRYLPGFYFEDETGCYWNDEPYSTWEEAEETLRKYVKFNLNGGN